MKSGHGRLILRDGTDLPIGYCLFRSEVGVGCYGILIGNIRSVGQDRFLKPIKITLNNGDALVAYDTGHSERHVRFVTNLGRLMSRSKGRLPQRTGPSLAIAQ